jgi:hypothetical protein
MTPNGPRSGLIFSKKQYENHISRSLALTRGNNQASSKNETITQESRSPQKAIEMTSYTINPLSTHQRPQPHGLSMFDTEKWAQVSWKQNDRHKIFPMVFTSVLSLESPPNFSLKH